MSDAADVLSAVEQRIQALDAAHARFDDEGDQTNYAITLVPLDLHNATEASADDVPRPGRVSTSRAVDRVRGSHTTRAHILVGSVDQVHAERLREVVEKHLSNPVLT